jgi:histone H3/H4
MDISSLYWRKCSSCKLDIGYRKTYYKCNVSTCNRNRTGLVFCSVPCFECHLPSARHRDAYAIEEKSPSFEQWKQELESEDSAPSSAPAVAKAPAPATNPNVANPRVFLVPKNPQGLTVKKVRETEVLVVASKVKDYIRRNSEMNTSGEVLQALSDQIRSLCDKAMDSARADGRKTVMERDFKK